MTSYHAVAIIEVMVRDNNRKQEIAEKALELFSIYGYEATSLSMIAEAVGIRKASLFNHYSGKQAILDEIIKTIVSDLNERSAFTGADWNDEAYTSRFHGMGAGEASAMVISHVKLITGDLNISRGRRVLMIEQFRDRDMAALLTKQNYTDLMKFFTGMMEFLIRDGVLEARDPEIMAAQFALPVTGWISLIDRDPERIGEVEDLIQRHVKAFFESYSK